MRAGQGGRQAGKWMTRMAGRLEGAVRGTDNAASLAETTSAVKNKKKENTCTIGTYLSTINNLWKPAPPAYTETIILLIKDTFSMLLRI